MASFSPSVEQWRSLAQSMGAGIPIDFLLKWIEVESGGNPCSWTTLRESGLFQLMYGDNQNAAGTTEALLRAACVAGASKAARPLTDAEKAEQVRAGVQYVTYAMSEANRLLGSVGSSWSGTDYGKAVKMIHVAPGAFSNALKAFRLRFGRGPSSWAEFASFAPGAGIPSNWLANADKVGAYWGLQIPGLLLAATALVAVVYYIKKRR